jgi:RimJ/RimL family protein N-acetyltransferase
MTLIIEPLRAEQFEDFLRYLNDHLSDNGVGGTAYFQPLPRAESFFPAEKAEAFQAGLATPVGAPGWRRAWVARADDGRIAGHVDLRAHHDKLAAHRCLLGMGVDRAFRRQGLGARLIAHAVQWTSEIPSLAWIDLQVLSANQSAVRLYRRSGFSQTGEIPDMFRIDEQSYAYTAMSRPAC